MSQSINTNLASLNAQRQLSSSQNAVGTAMQRLSSGLRVNSAKDDAAGLAIAERMNAQVRGMNVAQRNANDGISMTQTAEGALGRVGDALQRMRELAVQSANDSNSSSDKDSLNQEFGQLAAEIQRVLGGTTFNGKAILAGAAGTLSFQIGANTTSNDSLQVVTSNLTSETKITALVSSAGSAAVSIGAGASSGAIAGSGGVVDKLDAALNLVNDQRALMGAAQSRFESVISNLQTSVENQSAAKSRIMDTDFAAETANLSRAQILQQAGTAMLAQANQQPQQVLKLLQG